MFVGHMPAGYILTSAMRGRAPSWNKALMATGLVASILPDADLLWFYMVDQRQTVHHAYITHTPAFWLGVAAAALTVCWVMKWRVGPLFVGVALANVLLHLALDSIAAEVYWLWPFPVLPVNIVHIPAHYGWWVWNFVLHWTFALELIVILVAVVLWTSQRKRPER